MLSKIYCFFYRIVQWVGESIKIKIDPIGYSLNIGVHIGKNCKLGAIDRGTFGTEPYLITLGDHVEITLGVRFITHDGAVWVFRENDESIDLIKPINIGNNVFLGMGTLILPGVRIGNNVIIGAGSVVVSNIPSNSVAVGVPAKVIKSLESYYTKVSPQFLYTKNMADLEKRRYLIDKFRK